MSYYTCSKCGEGGLNQYGHGKIDGTFSCDNKPEPKKEKPMTLFRKKPVVIEAFRFRIDPIPDWFMDMVTINAITTDQYDCKIQTLEGVMRAKSGDYIIKGVKGEIYPCKPDIFAMTYESINSTVEKFGDDK